MLCYVEHNDWFWHWGNRWGRPYQEQNSSVRHLLSILLVDRLENGCGDTNLYMKIAGVFDIEALPAKISENMFWDHFRTGVYMCI